MFDPVVNLALLGGTIARIPSFLIQGKRCGCATWKIIPMTALLTVFELAGTMILFFIENGWVGGLSYFGGILLLPLFSILLAWLLRIPYEDFMDMTATGAGGMLAVMRLQCLYFGCCGGRVLFQMGGNDVVFPNQLSEIVTVLVITVILLRLGKQEKYHGKLYPLYLIIYGSVRFCLNWLRAETEAFIWFLPAGNFWALVAITVGLCWLNYKKKH